MGPKMLTGSLMVFGTIGFIGFLGWPIMTIVLGILTILSARKDALGIPPTK